MGMIDVDGQAGATMELLTPLVADIRREGLSLVGDVSAEELGLAETDAVVRGTLSVSLDLAKADDMITVTGVVEGTAVRQCVRCLKEYDDPLAFSVRAAFAREVKEAKKETKVGIRQSGTVRLRKGQPVPIKLDLGIDEIEGDDRYFYHGDYVELGPMLREHVILAAPMQPLCHEHCAGLCARCGQDLNTGPCQCPVEPPTTAIRVIRNGKQK
jgi:uncharacterized protein